MKLRIRGDSLRIRLSQSEVATFAERGALEDSTSFGPSGKLTYAMAFGDSIGATLTGARILVTIPAAAARAWATNEEVGLEAAQSTGEGTLKILVEKDFACLTPRGEEDADAFPHPKEATGESC